MSSKCLLVTRQPNNVNGIQGLCIVKLQKFYLVELGDLENVWGRGYNLIFEESNSRISQKSYLSLYQVQLSKKRLLLEIRSK
jgi:hypothetical protein